MANRLCVEWATTRSAVSSRFDQSYECKRPAKVEALQFPFSPEPRWVPVCGIHARQFGQTRPLVPVEPES